MDDDTFDDINEHSFVDDASDNDNEDNNNGNNGNNLNLVLQAWNDLPQGPAHAVNQQHGAGGQQAHLHHEAMIPSQDHDFQSQVHVVTRPMVGPERSHIPEPRPQNVETEVLIHHRKFAHGMQIMKGQDVNLRMGYGIDRRNPWYKLFGI